MNIKEYLKNRKILADGAFGTYYARISPETGEAAELANIKHPEVVEKIHLAYVQAGARLLRTNTFAAGREVLGCSKKEQKEIIRAGYRLAKKAAESIEEEVYVAADFGPIPAAYHEESENIIEEYKEICDAFIEEGAEIFLFETFSDFYHLQEVIPYIKEKSDAFIMTQFSVNRYGYTKAGISAARLMKTAGDMTEIDAVGFNCGIGSGHLLQVLEGIELPGHKFVTAFPNSGYPEIHQDRTVYLDNHQYFAEKLGDISRLNVNIVGGCCGTTPDYIKEAGNQIDYSFSGVRKNKKAEKSIVFGKKKATNPFLAKLLSGEKVIAVELDPPFDGKTDRIMECANLLKAQGVDMITFADSPMGRGRTDSILMGIKAVHETGAPVMPHICCRDKNAIAIRAGLLGGYMNHIRNLLVVTGDPIPKGETKSVFDFNSIKLMEFIRELNAEHFPEEPLIYGGALNQGRANIDNEMKRMEKKIKAGASYFLTQPVFSEEDIERISYIKRHVDTKILCGIMPLVSYRNASFIKNEISGIHVPDEVLSGFHLEMTREEGEEAGIKIAAEVIRRLDNIADGYYFMLPFNRVHLVEACLKKSLEVK